MFYLPVLCLRGALELLKAFQTNAKLIYKHCLFFVVYLSFLLLFQHSLVSFCPFLASLIQVHVRPDAKSGPGEHQHYRYSWNPVWRETEDKQRSAWHKLTTLNTLTHAFYHCCITETHSLCSQCKNTTTKGLKRTQNKSIGSCSFNLTLAFVFSTQGEAKSLAPSAVKPVLNSTHPRVKA